MNHAAASGQQLGRLLNEIKLQSRSRSNLDTIDERLVKLAPLEQQQRMHHKNRNCIKSDNDYTPVTRRVSLNYASDASWQDIEQHGLKAVLASKVPLAYFMCSLIADMSVENILFYIEAVRYETEPFASVDIQKKAAEFIYSQFLRADSNLEVNVDAGYRKLLQERLKSTHKDTKYLSSCFAEIKESVLKNLKESWRSFTQTDLYKQLSSDMEQCGVFSEQLRRKAVKLLVAALTPKGSLGRMRVKQLKPYIFKFIRRYLEIDIDRETLAVGEVKQQAQQPMQPSNHHLEFCARFFTPH